MISSLRTQDKADKKEKELFKNDLPSDDDEARLVKEEIALYEMQKRVMFATENLKNLKKDKLLNGVFNFYNS